MNLSSAEFAKKFLMITVLIYHMYSGRQACANIVDPDETL